MPRSLRATVVIVAGALAAGCGGSDSLRVSLADVDPFGDFWAIKAACDGGSFGVEFVPGDRVSLPDLARISDEEIEVECGEPERVVVTPEEGAPLPADQTDPVSTPVRLACAAGGVLFVSTHPIWGERSVVGSSVLVVHRNQAIVTGVLKRDLTPGDDWSRVSWSRSVCKRTD
jgi:hypothetical protein